MQTNNFLLALLFGCSSALAQGPVPGQPIAQIPAPIQVPAQKPLIIKSNDPRLHYMGRIMHNDSAAILSWPATSVDINFTGPGAKVLLRDEKGDNYYNIIVDGRVAGVIHPDRSMRLYTLASGLPAGRHHLELFKRTESLMGTTWLYQFEFERNTI